VSNEKIVDFLGTQLERRKFLKTLGAGALLAVAGVIGLGPGVASAYSYKCCNLCEAPSSCSNPECDWCWYCCNTSDNTWWRCCEVHTGLANCGRNCSNIDCSTATLMGDWCLPGFQG
jgi:hypothetical protein